MHRILLFAFAMMCSLAVSAQLTLLQPDAVSGDLDFDVEVKSKAYNNTGATQTLRWRRTDVQTPSNWLTFVCIGDDITGTCYPPETSTQTLSLADGDSIQVKLGFSALGVAGMGEATIHLFVDGDSANTATSAIFRAAAINVSSHSVVKERISIYPNPAADYIRIRNIDVFDKLQVYNVVGKQLKEMDFKGTGATYPVYDIPNGFYLVRILDKNQKVIKTVRLRKTLSP